MATTRSPRSVTFADRDKPIYAVWEITLRCNQACAHCGSRAGPTEERPDELSTAELLEVAAELVRLGTREVTLIGGEAYLRDDIFDIVHFLSAQGIRVTMQTGGRGLSPRLAKALKDAGMKAVGVSVDGPEEIHDVLRDSVGSWRSAMRALEVCKEVGLVTSSNTQVNNLNAHMLREIGAMIKKTGVRVWRVQLTVPMGRAADRPEWILDPPKILDVIDTLAAMQLEEVAMVRAKGLPPERAFNIMSSNNVGYYGPHEQVLRSRPGGDEAYWRGCQAGVYTIGIESDGTVKGCPSLPTAPYTGGKVRDLGLEEIWKNAEELNFVRERTTEELWGFCKTCYYADICRAGCSFTTHCTLGRRGNNPFCYHRAATLKREGRKERLVLKEAAAGIPYDFGRFEIVEEPWDAGDAAAQESSPSQSESTPSPSTSVAPG